MIQRCPSKATTEHFPVLKLTQSIPPRSVCRTAASNIQSIKYTYVGYVWKWLVAMYYVTFFFIELGHPALATSVISDNSS